MKTSSREDRKLVFRWKIVRAVTAATGLFLAAGCSLFQPPVERRIERNQTLFDGYPPEVRANLRRGEIDIGYEEDMARIALGHPARRYRRSTPQGDTMIWIYLDENVRSRPQWTTVNLPTYDPQGRRIMRLEELRLDLEEHREHTKTRVEFREGKVIAIERLLD